jgi:membrane protein YdbS with pleckstrin-like domain
MRNFMKQLKNNLTRKIKEIWIILLMILGMIGLALWMDMIGAEPMRALWTMIIFVPVCVVALWITKIVQDRRSD